jgi:hypothetical protein
VDSSRVDNEDVALTPANRGILVQNHKQVSTPSEPGTPANSFTMEYGAMTPPPPN